MQLHAAFATLVAFSPRIMNGTSRLATQLGSMPVTPTSCNPILALPTYCFELRAEVLESMHQQWQSSQLPQLERRAHKTWQQAQHSDQQTHWQMDAGHWQEHLAKLVLEVARAHLYRAKLATKALRRGCQSIQQILFNLHEVLFKLSVAHLPEAPPKPNRKRAAAERYLLQCACLSTAPASTA